MMDEARRRRESCSLVVTLTSAAVRARGRFVLMVGFLLCSIHSFTTVTFVHGQWKYNGKSQPDPIVDVSLAAQPYLPVSFLDYTYAASYSYLDNSGVSQDAIFRDITGSYLASACSSNISNVPNETYGFARWKNDIFGRVTLTNSGKRISILFRQLPGFTLLANELVTCKVASGNTLYYLPLKVGDIVDPREFWIMFRASPLKPSITFDSPLLKGSASPSENDVRTGFTLTLVLRNDAWLSSSAQAIADGFVATPPESIEAVRSLFSPAFLNISEQSPNLATFVVPAAVYKRFNIANTTTIRFVPSDVMTFKKSKPEASALLFRITANTASPKITMTTAGSVNNLLDLSENCFRGEETGCVIDQSFRIDGAIFNAIPTANEEVADGVAPTLALEPFVAGLINDVNTAAQSRVLNVKLNKIPDLDISEEGNYTFNISASLISNGEPPDAVFTPPLIVRVRPSPGKLTGTLANIDSSVIWEGGYVANFTLRGETWVQEEVLRSLRGSMTVTTINGANASSNSKGWSSQIGTLLPSSALTFTNNRTLRMELAQAVEYEPLSSEKIELIFTAAMVKSGILPIASVGVAFTINRVPGRLVVSGRSKFYERDVWDGNVRFNLTLAGDSWVAGVSFTNCVKDMVSPTSSRAWSTSAPNDGGFGNASVRSLLMMESNFRRVDARNVEVMWPVIPDYEVIKGEAVTMLSQRSCTVSGEQPTGTPALIMLPEQALVRVSFVTANGQPVPFSRSRSLQKRTANATLPVITESRLRNGDFNITIELQYDRFNFTEMLGIIESGEFSESRATTVAGLILEQMRSTGVGPFGWNEKKSFMTSSAQIDISNSSRISIAVSFFAPYSISVPEEVYIDVPGWWMASTYPPRDPVAFIVDVSPGLLLLRNWTGASSGNAIVTEDQVRRGAVWFNVSLLGDSWLQSRIGYAASFAVGSPTPQAGGFAGQREFLTPEPSFNTYWYDGSYENLILRMQASPSFDIAYPEDITVAFDGRTTASGLTPFWLDATGAEVRTFQFTVIPTQGLLVVSGFLDSPTETTLRTQSMRVVLSLFAETWSANATAKLREFLAGDDAAPTAFNSLKSRFLPPGSVAMESSNVVVMSLSAVPDYSIDMDETLTLHLRSSMFASGLVPRVLGGLAATRIGVRASGGDLSFRLNIDATEENFVSANGLTLSLTLLGDAWQADVVRNRVAELIGAFSSDIPLFQAPRGFSVFVKSAIEASAFRLVSVSQLDVHFCGSCAARSGYRADVDETITFTLPSTDFLRTGVAASPMALSFVLKKARDWVVLIVDERIIGTNYPKRRFDSDDFLGMVASMLVCDSERVMVITSSVTDGVRVRLSFQGSPVPGEDERSAAELFRTWTSFNAKLLFNNFSVVLMYNEAEGPPAMTTTTAPVPALPFVSANDSISSRVEWWMWLGLLFVIGGIAAAIAYLGDLLRRPSMPLSKLPPPSRKQKKQPIVVGASFLTGDEEFSILLDERKHHAGQQQRRDRHAIAKPQAVSFARADVEPKVASVDGQRLREFVRNQLKRDAV